MASSPPRFPRHIPIPRNPSRNHQIPPPHIPIPTALAARINDPSSSTEHRAQPLSPIPSMAEIMDSSRARNLQLRVQTRGPLFTATATIPETGREIGRGEGMIRVWVGGRILHLDSVRLSRETVSMDRSIFGIGLILGAVMVRHGYDWGCRTAQLLAINDTDLYHSKLVRFYTRIGFRSVREVTGSSMADLPHMLVWGGRGTLMEADVQHLLRKWYKAFRPNIC